MKLLLKFLTKYKWLVVLSLVLAAINQTFSMIDPYLFRRIIDEYLVPEGGALPKETFLKGVSMLILMALGAAMVSRIAKNFQDYLVNVITQKVGADLYTYVLEHSLSLPFQVFEDQRSGETLGKLQKARTDVERMINAMVNIVFTTLVGIVFVAIYSFSIHWSIAPAYFLTIPLVGGISSLLSKKIKHIQKKIVGETTALSGSTTESLRNIELVKSLGLARQEIKRLNENTMKILGLELQKVRYIRSISFLQGTFINLLRNSILFLMAYLVFHNYIKVGEMFSLFIYSFFIFGPLQELGNIINIYRETEVSLHNIQEILETPAEVVPEQPIDPGRIHHLKFEDVSFTHQSATQPAVQHINFEVGIGETIAFVGPSGSGKTTLVKLLVGLYPPQSGSILYNHADIKQIHLDYIRCQMGFVTQESQLFSGTIRENLLFVKPEATIQELVDVLHKASCQNLLLRAKEGLGTVIGENGMKVSGGEKQRLSIARALLRNPTVLVFDEATSALDSITEEEISQTVRHISSGKKHITVMIAHRLSTIMHADRIYVLEHGQVIESGKHQDLLDEKGLYYAMWRQQIGERKRIS